MRLTLEELKIIRDSLSFQKINKNNYDILCTLRHKVIDEIVKKELKQ